MNYPVALVGDTEAFTINIIYGGVYKDGKSY
jgi:hypothetical protein